MTRAELDNWLKNLKSGDKVGVFELFGKRFIHEKTVARRTPSGRIVLASNAAYRPDGSYLVHSSSCYADRCLRPLPEIQKEQ